MIRSLPFARPQSAPLRSILALRARAASPCRTPRSSSSPELSRHLVVRRASSSSSTSSPSSPRPALDKSQPHPRPPPRPQFEVPPRSVIYHMGTPRIMFLGALKLTTVFVFGFFAVAVIPAHVSAGQPLWQTAGLAVASTIPFLAVWYLTSPMAMWVQVRVPDPLRRTRHLASRYLASPPAGAELAVTTMGALGGRRVSHVTVSDLRPAPGRPGLANYVRDPAGVARENARRRWWMFRAVRGFRIEDGTAASAPGWDGVARQIRERAPRG